MTIQIELTPETEAHLSAVAATEGLAIQEYVDRLVQGHLKPVPAPNGELTVEEFHKMLEEMGKGSENLPKLPTSAFSRESFYEGRP